VLGHFRERYHKGMATGRTREGFATNKRSVSPVAQAMGIAESAVF